MRINTNTQAMNANRVLDTNTHTLGKSIKRLSSGFRINRGADAAAGLAVSEIMRSQIKGYEVASRNAQDGVSLVQTADGGLNSLGESLQRLRELSLQASNGTYTDSDPANLQAEVTQLLSEIDSVGQNMTFNQVAILGCGSVASTGITLSLGPNGEAINLTIATVASGDLGVGGVDVSTQAGAVAAIASIDAAISTVTTQRADLGALQNRLEKTIDNLALSRENLSAAESRIRNTDMAKEMTDFTRLQILQQAGTAMLAQANAMPQSVLQLLG